MKKLDRLEMMKEAYSELVSRLCDIRTMFNFTADSDMIEALIYEEKSVLCKLAFLSKAARAEGLDVAAIEEKNG
ncbi:MAG: hypothetical protein ACI4JY_02505 [Oscillospiraceae bacterium]